MPARHLVRLALVALALIQVPSAVADGPKARDLLLDAASAPTPAGVHVVFAAGADGALAPEAYVVTIVP